MYLALPVKSATSARFCPQTTHELHKKHHEAGRPEQLTTDALSQIDYGNTRHWEDCKEFCWCQEGTTQRAFWKLCVGACAWLSGRWASRTFQKAPPPLVSIKCRIYLINQLLDNKPDKSSLQSRGRYFINFYQIKSSSIDVLSCLPRALMTFKSRYFSCSQLPFSAAIKDGSFEPILSSLSQCDCILIVVTVSGITKPPIESLERASGKLFSVNVSLINKSPSTEEAIFVLQTRNENGIITRRYGHAQSRSITSRDVGRRVQDRIWTHDLPKTQLRRSNRWAVTRFLLTKCS